MGFSEHARYDCLIDVLQSEIITYIIDPFYTTKRNPGRWQDFVPVIEMRSSQRLNYLLNQINKQCTYIRISQPN